MIKDDARGAKCEALMSQKKKAYIWGAFRSKYGNLYDAIYRKGIDCKGLNCDLDDLYADAVYDIVLRPTIVENPEAMLLLLLHDYFYGLEVYGKVKGFGDDIYRLESGRGELDEAYEVADDVDAYDGEEFGLGIFKSILGLSGEQGLEGYLMDKDNIEFGDIRKAYGAFKKKHKDEVTDEDTKTAMGMVEKEITRREALKAERSRERCKRSKENKINKNI